MNKELKDRIFEVPKDVLEFISDIFTNLNGKNVTGIDRASKLLLDKKVNYGQLKRIIHDLENTDKYKEKIKYDLYGGDKMLYWGKQHLKGERDLVKNKKKSKKRADEIASITGLRKNSFLSKHNKSMKLNIPTNLVKSNSDKSSISPITSLGLFEEINKIKKLINY
jgi:hypothetical protein